MVPFNIPTPWCVKSPRKLGNEPPTWASTRRVPCEGHPSIPNLRASWSSRKKYNYYYLFIFNLDAGSLISCTLSSEHTATGTPASPCSCIAPGSCVKMTLHPTPTHADGLLYLLYPCLTGCAPPGRASWCCPFVWLCFSTHLPIFCLTHWSLKAQPCCVHI